MNLKIFTTSRQIRKWLEDKDNQFLDKFYTLGEFLGKIVVVEGRKFIDEDLRKKYLFEAIKNVDIEKLGISREFINFFDDSSFIFSFFNELFLEDVDIDNVILSDVYLDYAEHLEILKEIRKNYKNLIEKDGYTDKFLIEDFRINKGLLEGIDKIEMVLDGYLSKFDLKVLEKIKIPVEITFSVDRFNKILIEKSLKIAAPEGYIYKLDFHNSKLQKLDKKINSPEIEIAYFSERLNQVNFVFAKISQMVNEGIEPEKIAVILPDEEFSEYLKLFDEYKNLNFAMGESFTKSNLYILLKSIYEFITSNSDIAFKKCKDYLEAFEKKELSDFIKKTAANKELKIIDEELFKLEKFKNMFENKKDFLFFVLERFKNLKIDDVYSGKITCMGVLESRGMEFDGVIILDFNEDIVPKVSESDLFLNTFIRRQAKLPTRNDRENLQKHYYYQLINSAKKVAISYVKNEEKSPSRFLYELGFSLGKNGDEKYREIAFKYSKPKEITKYSDEFEILYPLYPTQLKNLVECPKKYYFSKILGIFNEKDEEEFFGNIFHEAVADIVRNKKLKMENDKDYFDILMKEITKRINDKKLLFDVLVKWEDNIKTFCKIDFDQMKYSKNETEVTKKFIFEGKELACRVDRIDYKENEIILIDYKTSSKAGENEEYIYDFQTTFYFLWAKQNYPDKNIKTVIWDLGSEKPGKIEGVVKMEELKEVLNNLPKKIKAAEDIIYIDKNGKEKTKKALSICKYCDYKIACGRD
ncbi:MULTISPECIES: PD-(D/E)XK nuclease family protein [unclassified Lebetimonas]|uniref:PD-(D/E)XK nuclease family protein n=1 Tax=unclassified Lebetimonas TaxID=2648158 RepID=UPI000465768D|nr:MULTISPECIES: PD-(D/E)XK nuclease family protein [unclassified Lebetimonas]